MVRATLPGPRSVSEISFGVRDAHHPRFVVQDGNTIGVWTDNGRPACAIKEMDGWRSVYLGTAPATIEVLRWLAELAEARLWSTRPDVVLASEDAAMIVATSTGPRTLTLHKPLAHWEGGDPRSRHALQASEGDVTLFLPCVLRADYG